MESPYQLLIKPPVVTSGDTGGIIASIASEAREWKRSARLVGGYWSGSFKMEMDLALAQWWFYEALGLHVEEHAGGEKTWEGRIHQIDLITGGYRYRVSIEKLFNAIKVKYTNRTTGTDDETAWATNATSIATFGRRELIDTQGKMESSMATARRDTLLKELSQPNAEFVSFEDQRRGGARLEFVVTGYAFTLNDKFVTVQSGTSVNVSTYIDAILSTDCAFVASRLIRTNTLAVLQKTSLGKRAWDEMKSLTGLGDASGNPWRLYMGNERKVFYEMIDPAPLYFVRDREWYSRSAGSARANPWSVKPGVVRNARYPFARKIIGSFLEDARDVVVGEVEVDYKGNIVPKSETYTESVILNAQYKEQEQN